MKNHLLICLLACLMTSCGPSPTPWTGSVLTPDRAYLTVTTLVEGPPQPLVDMSYFARPEWADEALQPFSGTLEFSETTLTFAKTKAYYPGEALFPNFTLDLIAHEGTLLPRIRKKISVRHQSTSMWDVVVDAGKVWHEAKDSLWSRASFPLTLTDRWVGQARNCVATFVYRDSTVSNLCLQCSQETADIDDQQLGNISAMLPVNFRPVEFTDAAQLISVYQQEVSARLPVRPLSDLDLEGTLGENFDQMLVTNAPTSMGAVWANGKLYRHPPQTRHGQYPYPHAMRHALYSVTKTMTGALAMMYFSQRYEEDVFQALIADYVPVLRDHPGWEGVTFGHTLNMATGTVGSERLEHFYSTVIVAETAEQAITNIAGMGDAPPAPGEQFNYASANFFVLSYALQRYVEQKEEPGVNYWDLVQTNVLAPIGAEHFSLLRTMEEDSTTAIPVLALGALPTLDEAAKVALLFQQYGRKDDQQLLDAKKIAEVFDAPLNEHYATGQDIRGTYYRHGFWSKEVNTEHCPVRATYMLGFGENYIIFLPSGAIIFRFLDEHDLNVDPLIQAMERVMPSCGE